MTKNGYEKVLEVYLLSILPALGDWTYAKQFIRYETELPVQNREVHHFAQALPQFL